MCYQAPVHCCAQTVIDTETSWSHELRTSNPSACSLCKKLIFVAFLYVNVLFFKLMLASQSRTCRPLNEFQPGCSKTLHVLDKISKQKEKRNVIRKMKCRTRLDLVLPFMWHFGTITKAFILITESVISRKIKHQIGRTGTFAEKKDGNCGCKSLISPKTTLATCSPSVCVWKSKL